MKRGRSRSDDGLFDENNGASPVLTRKTKSNCVYNSDSDSDNEIIFTQQANKKRKMSGDETLRLWISGELAKQMAPLATKDQLSSLVSTVCLLYTSDAADE